LPKVISVLALNQKSEFPSVVGNAWDIYFRTTILSLEIGSLIPISALRLS